MKLIILSLILFSFISCSHHHKKPEHHHHQFDKKCAYEVGQNHFDIEGAEEFKIVHGGETYYFSSAEKMQSFQSDLDQNIKRSKENWMKGPPSSRKKGSF